MALSPCHYHDGPPRSLTKDDHKDRTTVVCTNWLHDGVKATDAEIRKGSIYLHNKAGDVATIKILDADGKTTDVHIFK